MIEPLVSCLTVTADRPELMAIALRCFELQTYQNRELVVIDDGNQDLSPLFDNSPCSSKIQYVKIRKNPDATLGDLRNLSIEVAHGDWLIQWDDDDWYHPQRIETQLQYALEHQKGASALKHTLVRMDDSNGETLSFRADCGIATPGTILFKRGDLRYPSLRRNEDGIFMRAIRDELGLAVIGKGESHLFIRVHHGSNTWSQQHFYSKLSRTVAQKICFFWFSKIRRNLRGMPGFQLTFDEIQSLQECEAMRTTTRETVRS